MFANAANHAYNGELEQGWFAVTRGKLLTQRERAALQSGALAFVHSIYRTAAILVV